MKRLMILILTILISGCVGMTPQPSVCDSRGEQFSWICDRSEQLGLNVESVYGVVFSATAAATLIEVKNGPMLKRHEVCDFVTEWRDWFEIRPTVSYTALINHGIVMTNVLEDPDRVALIISILNRNLAQYQSSLWVAAYDRQMILDGMNLFLSDMLCY